MDTYSSSTAIVARNTLTVFVEVRVLTEATEKDDGTASLVHNPLSQQPHFI